MGDAANQSDRPHYVVCGFDHLSGPVKSVARLVEIQAHNSREEDLPHVVPGAPAPLHLIGSGDLVADVERVLSDHGVSKVRRGGNYAWEAVLTASHFFFFDADGVLDIDKMANWVVSAQQFAIGFWGRHRLASMVLHADEYTPHLHIVVIPLAYREDGRFGARWTLDTAVLSGPGEWQRLHTAYAEAMEPFGLHRGKLGSGQKFKPFAEVLAEIEMSQERLAEAEEQAARAGAAAREAKDRAAALIARLEEQVRANAEEKAALVAERKATALAREKVELDLAEAAEQIAIAEWERRDVERAWDSMDRYRDELNDLKDTLSADDARISIQIAELEAEKEKVSKAAEFIAWAERTARDFSVALQDVPNAALPHAVREALRKMDHFKVALDAQPAADFLQILDFGKGRER